LKAGIEKWDTKHGGSLGQVDLSLLSGTDVKDDAGEDSASSDDGMKSIRNDLERQKQVSPPQLPHGEQVSGGFYEHHALIRVPIAKHMYDECRIYTSH
jgi:hypothetical protein